MYILSQISLWIKLYWNVLESCKKNTRDNCNYTWSGLQVTVPKALNSVPLITIRKFARKSWRYMDIYKKGITGKLTEFAIKSINHIVVYIIQFIMK